MRSLTEAEWMAAAAVHRQRLAPVVDLHLERRSRHEKHPLLDFLFQYYTLSPARLLHWVPGLGTEVRGGAADALLAEHGHVRTPTGGVTAGASLFPARRVAALRWVIALLERTAGREARFSCFALHEWAMVYGAEQVRHGQLPLRLGRAETDAFLASQTVCCSHYDAFRFFTPAARPLNALQPAREDMLELEQAGCLHANMDLYKWAGKFLPWTGSELVADCFLLAVDARVLDMQAGPYDCSALGVAPLPVETAEGRQRFAVAQRDLAGRAAPLRRRLLDRLRELAAGAPSPSAS